jgi:hypothetical protein
MVEGELISITTLMHNQGRNPETVLTKFDREILGLQDAQELGYPVGEAAYIIQRLRRADGVRLHLRDARPGGRLVPLHGPGDAVVCRVVFAHWFTRFLFGLVSADVTGICAWFIL